jgi:hypothetical protein
MSNKTSLNIVVHVNDETLMDASRVPSSDTDFVSVKVGPDVNVLLFNSAQAKAFIQAVMDARRILRTIEAEVEDAEMTRALYEDEDDEDYGPYCTDDNPCDECLAYNDEYEYGRY